MNPGTRLLGTDRRIVWMLVMIISIAAGAAAWILARDVREDARAALLKNEARRLGIELMSQTVNGSLIGAAAFLGLTDEDVKRDARGEVAPNGAAVTRLLRIIANNPNADGAFVVGQDGFIKSSFGTGKSSTGADVRFRPYYKAAREGKASVYAAVGTTTGLRTLYFAAPAYQGDTAESATIGAVIARGGMAPIDRLLKGRSEIALLLSPQGVVFAGNRDEWIGALDTRPSPERLKEIRALKQFGTMFDSKEPAILPISPTAERAVVGAGRFAIAREAVQWNDPLGDWQLVLMEDLTTTVAASQNHIIGIVVALTVLGLLVAFTLTTRSRQEQRAAAGQLAAFAERQQRAVANKSKLAAAAIKLQQAHEAGDIAQTFLVQAHQVLRAFQGVVYVMADGDSQRMTLAASYACADAPHAELLAGEGLLGECALAGEAQVIETPPGGIWSIQSGLGHTRPAALMMAPVAVQGVLLGVVELAVLDVPDEETRQMFGEMVELLALNLKLASRQPSAGGTS
jgi:C4-dicarboxylate-specific signal transduction histidine kinase